VSLAQDSLPMQQSQLSQQHQLVQQATPEQQQQCNSHLTWEEAVSAPILPIRCKDTNAELHKSKFGSGNKGKCIKLGSDWLTPTEFEALCGRGNSKDWKRSIRFGGRTLQTLIDKGFLIPHASSCICSNCVDDATAVCYSEFFVFYFLIEPNPSPRTHGAENLRRASKSFLIMFYRPDQSDHSRHTKESGKAKTWIIQRE